MEERIPNLFANAHYWASLLQNYLFRKSLIIIELGSRIWASFNVNWIGLHRVLGRERIFHIFTSKKH